MGGDDLKALWQTSASTKPVSSSQMSGSVMSNQNNEPNKQLESFDDINRKDRVSLISKLELDE